MKKQVEFVVQTELGLTGVINIKDRKIFIYYQDKKCPNKLGKIIELLKEKSKLDYLELASFQILIEELHSSLTTPFEYSQPMV